MSAGHQLSLPPIETTRDKMIEDNSSFTDSSDEYFLRTYFVSGPVLDARDIAENTMHVALTTMLFVV